MILTISLSGMVIGFPVLKEVRMPFFVIGADGSDPFSCCGLALTFGGAVEVMHVHDLYYYISNRDTCRNLRGASIINSGN